MMIIDVHQAVLVIDRLLNCPDLNLDSLEEETVEAIEFAQDFMWQYDGKPVVIPTPAESDLGEGDNDPLNL